MTERIIAGQPTKPQEVLKSSFGIKTNSSRSEGAGESLSSLIVQAGGSHSVHLNNPHQRRMWLCSLTGGGSCAKEQVLDIGPAPMFPSSL